MAVTEIESLFHQGGDFQHLRRSVFEQEQEQEQDRALALEQVREWAKTAQVRADAKAAEEAETQRIELEKIRAREAREARKAAEIEKAERRLLPVKEFIDSIHRALSDPFPARLLLPTPVRADSELIREWVRHDGSDDKTSESPRLMSARLAERGLAGFFEARGASVEDVSGSQIATHPNPDWKNYDLLVDQSPIDVKNARHFRDNPNRYVSHCVARFKQARNVKAVTIAGVLSDYTTLEEMAMSSNTALFLGMTTLADQIKLREAFSGGLLEINFRDSTAGSPILLPPWVFQYPEDFYVERNAALDKLPALQLLDWELCHELGVTPLPAFIATGTAHGNLPPSLSPSQAGFIHRFEIRRQFMGLQLPLVFVSVLEHFLMELQEPAAEFNRDHYEAMLFATTEDRSRPLFLFDQLLTVVHLLVSLSTIWGARNTHLVGFTMFRLVNLNILIGKRSARDGRWLTLLAYCGDWLEKPTRKPCGTTPLVLGKHVSCTCGKLICPNCGSCSSRCPDRAKRIAANREHSGDE